MPPNDPNQGRLFNPNDIDINLHLLAEDDISKISDVFSMFKTSVDQLTKSTEQIANALGGTTGPGGTGVRAARGPTQQVPPTLARTARDESDLLRATMIASSQIEGPGWAGKYAMHPQLMSDNERETMTSPRFGNFTMQDFVRMFGYQASKRAFEDNTGMVKRPGWLRAAGAAGVVQAGIPYVQGVRQLGGRVAGGARNFVASPQMVAAGQDLGISRSNGWLGTPFMSSAMTAGLGHAWQGALSSWFGMNPNYSSEDAAAAQSAISGMGIRDQAQRHDLTYTFRNLQQNTGIGADQISQMMYPGVRYGGTSMGDMITMINRIPAAAQQAGMSVENFVQSLSAAAGTLGQAHGISTTAATAQAQTFASATRLDPTTGANVMSSPLIRNLAFAQTGSFYQTMAGPHASSLAVGATEGLIARIMGVGSLREISQMRTRNPAAFKAARERLFSIYAVNPGLFGGMSAQEVLQMIERPGDMAGRAFAQENVNQLQGLIHNRSIGDRGSGNRNLDSLLNQAGAKLGLSNREVTGLGSTYQERTDELQRRIDKANEVTDAEKNRVTLDLTDSAKRLVKLADNAPERRPYGSAPAQQGVTPRR